MKTKLSISMNRETVAQLEALVVNGRFRNKSHIIEYSVQRFINGQ